MPRGLKSFAAALGAVLVSACTIPQEPGQEEAFRADLPLRSVGGQSLVEIVHQDPVTREQRTYQVLNPTGPASLEAAAAQVCTGIDWRFAGAELVPLRRIDGATKYYFTCV